MWAARAMDGSGDDSATLAVAADGEDSSKYTMLPSMPDPPSTSKGPSAAGLTEPPR